MSDEPRAKCPREEDEDCQGKVAAGCTNKKPVLYSAEILMRRYKVPWIKCDLLESVPKYGNCSTCYKQGEIGRECNECANEGKDAKFVALVQYGYPDMRHDERKAYIPKRYNPVFITRVVGKEKQEGGEESSEYKLVYTTENYLRHIINHERGPIAEACKENKCNYNDILNIYYQTPNDG